MISIIICTYNRAKYIRKTLEHIAACGAADYEILLINNCSTDSTKDECLSFAAAHPDVPFFLHDEPQQGLSYARNRGMREARGEWLVFLDDDAFVAKDYLRNLSAQLAAHRDAVAFGGRIVPFYEEKTEPTWMSRWTYSWVSALDKGEAVKRFGKDYPIGANMGVRRDFAEIAGDFDVTLGRTGNNLLGGEEKDFFNRIKRISDKIYYFPNVEVQHCIPPHRLEQGFIRRLAFGIGQSERLRTKASGGQKAYLSRCLSEGIKWAATLFLLVCYTLAFAPQKGWILVVFRYNVTCGLFSQKH